MSECLQRVCLKIAGLNSANCVTRCHAQQQEDEYSIVYSAAEKCTNLGPHFDELAHCSI